jgi:hypothetical protein
MGEVESNSQVLYVGQPYTAPVKESACNMGWVCGSLTCYDFGPLEMFIRVDVAWRQGKVQPQQDQGEVQSTPHDKEMPIRSCRQW